MNMHTSLDINRKPVVAFEPSNKIHRKYWAIFLRDRSWTHLPVRFAFTENVHDITFMINRQLAEYYVHKEFNSTVFADPEDVVKKPQKKLR
jgi:hypothetical protein